MEVEISETGMENAINSLLTENGFHVYTRYDEVPTTKVNRVGPNHDGAYQWSITVQNLGNVPLLSVDTSEMTCGSAPDSIQAGCNIVLYCAGNINDNFKLIKSLPYIDKFTSKKTSEFYKFLR